MFNIVQHIYLNMLALKLKIRSEGGEGFKYFVVPKTNTKLRLNKITRNKQL